MSKITDAEVRFYDWVFSRPVRIPAGGAFAPIEPESFEQLELFWRLRERWQYGRDPGLPSTMLRILA